mmetsp:Transcript_27729/g.58274  ORF Transcript_27729/g.58274 Transcript_27729/m.58274 type:complete len:153 (-) Transcript_27729:440-898(-)
MGFFSNSPRNNEYQHVEDPPLATAFPVSSSLPTVEAVSAEKMTTPSAPVADSFGGQILGRQPISIGMCPHCQQYGVMTRIRTYPSWETWFACAVLLLVFWPACWVPLVYDSVNSTLHYFSSIPHFHQEMLVQFNHEIHFSPYNGTHDTVQKD